MTMPVNNASSFLAGVSDEQNAPELTTTGTATAVKGVPAGSTFEGECLKFASAHDEESFANYIISLREHADTTRLAGVGEITYHARMVVNWTYTNGNKAIFGIRNFDSSTSIYKILVGGGGRLFVQSGAGVAAAGNVNDIFISSGDVIEIRVSYDRSGNTVFEIKEDGNGAYTTLSSLATTDADAGQYRAGVMDGTGNPTSGTMTVDLLGHCCYTNEDYQSNLETYTFDKYADVRGQTSTSLYAVLELDSGSVRNATQARLQWNAGSEISSPTTESWIALGSFNAGTLTLPVISQQLTGLSPGTEYALRWQLGDSGNSVIATGRTFTPMTFPTPGSGTAIPVGVISCVDHNAGDYKAVSQLNSLGARHRFCIGDLVYENVSFANDNYHGAGSAPSSFAGLSALWLTTFADPSWQALSLVAGGTYIIDDHPLNDIDSSWDGDAVNTLGGEGQYQWTGNTTTLGDAWDRLTAIIEQRFAQFIPNRGGTGKYYGYVDAGKYRFVFIDTRFESDRGAGTLMSAAQETWIGSTIASTPAGRNVVVIGQGSIVEYTTQPDSPWLFAEADCKSLADTMMSNLGSTNTLTLIYSDTHASPIAHNKLEGVSGVYNDARYRGSFCLSPTHQSLSSGSRNYNTFIPTEYQLHTRDLGTRLTGEAVSGASQDTAELAQYAHFVDFSETAQFKSYTGADADISVMEINFTASTSTLRRGVGPAIRPSIQSSFGVKL